MVCEKQKNKKADEYCPAQVKIRINDEDNHIQLNDRHNHHPAEENLDLPFLRRDIGRRAIDLFSDIAVPTRQLYNEEFIR